MNKVKFLISGALISAFVLGSVGCANKNLSAFQKKDTEIRIIHQLIGEEQYTGLSIKDEKRMVRELLTEQPTFAAKNRQIAVKENMRQLPNNMPLYNNPQFAQMVVFPYVSDSGIYHSDTESWIKIKEGSFALSDPKNPSNLGDKIFDFNLIGEK